MRPGPAILSLSLLLSLSLSAGTARAAVIDTGFRPDPDGFGFANAGDPEAFFGLDLNALAGTNIHDEVLRHTGHCFGMCEASIDHFLAGRASIGEGQAAAMPEIDRLQTAQSFFYLGECFRPPFLRGPDNRAGFAAALAQLEEGRPAVLDVYSSAGSCPGHAVVAYAVDRQEDVSLIYVYDPNLPPTLHDYAAEPLIAFFDNATGSFSYDNGQKFDELKPGAIDGAGVAGGQAAAAGLLALPLLATALVIAPRSRRRP